MIRYVLPTVSLTLCAALLVACSGGAASNPAFSDQAQSSGAVGASPEGGNPFAGLPSIPWDTDEAARESSWSEGDPGEPTDPDEPPAEPNIVILGREYLQKYNAEVDGDALLLLAPEAPEERVWEDGPPVAYGLYRASGLLDQRPLSLNIECLVEGIGHKYYVAVADYTDAVWRWYGPITFPEFEVDLRDEDHRLITHLGNMYFILVCPPGSHATHYQSTVVRGQGDSGGLPGTPHGLQASDGEFEGRVAVTWLPGAGAEHYEVFRRYADDTVPLPPPGGDPGDPTDGERPGDPGVPPDVEWGLIGVTPTTEFFDEPLPGGVHFLYKARAVNTAGASAFSNVDEGFAKDIVGDPYLVRGWVMATTEDPDDPAGALRPLPGVEISINHEMLPITVIAKTDEAGYFEADLPGMGGYIAAPNKDGWEFVPDWHTFFIDGVHEPPPLDFLAFPAGSGGGDPGW